MKEHKRAFRMGVGKDGIDKIVGYYNMYGKTSDSHLACCTESGCGTFEFNSVVWKGVTLYEDGRA